MSSTPTDTPPAPGEPLSDAALIARIGEGDASAFEALMRRYNRLLFRSARGVVRDDAEAQDVVQDTYLRAFATLHTFRGESAFGTWLARMAFDMQRKRSRSVPLRESLNLDAEPAPEHTMAFNAPAADSPEAVAERSQMRALLQRAIDSLPPIYRGVFILRAVQEMSVDETAECLQVSEAVVKTRYLRARSLLRDALGARLEAHAQDVYAFAGARCDAVVVHVLAVLRQQGRLLPEGSG